MIIGVPKEIKNHEYRVGMIPASVRELISHGHQVLVETNAGAGIGFSDDDYIAVICSSLRPGIPLSNPLSSARPSNAIDSNCVCLSKDGKSGKNTLISANARSGSALRVSICEGESDSNHWQS